MGFEIPKAKNLQQQVFNITNDGEFVKIALQVFSYQYLANPVYNAYCNAIRKNPDAVESLQQIPFLPIQFFKTKEIRAGIFEPEIVFKSSGTTSTASSRHFVKDVSLYEKSFGHCFEIFYGNPKEYCILGLLPSYIENGGSSLVYMVDWLIKKSGHPLSSFCLYDHEKLTQMLLELERRRQKTILFGVSYALLRFAEAFPMPLNQTIIVETGGMKGREKELTKAELYAKLKEAFSVDKIHSEYGMTELLSQAYAVNGIYKTPPWMKVLLRDETDPFSLSKHTGAINVIDLANIHSCSFIATDDLGRLNADGSFEVLGRIDNSDIRGCSQLAI